MSRRKIVSHRNDSVIVTWGCSLRTSRGWPQRSCRPYWKVSFAPWPHIRGLSTLCRSERLRSEGGVLEGFTATRAAESTPSSSETLGIECKRSGRWSTDASVMRGTGLEFVQIASSWGQERWIAALAANCLDVGMAFARRCQPGAPMRRIESLVRVIYGLEDPERTGSLRQDWALSSTSGGKSRTE